MKKTILVPAALSLLLLAAASGKAQSNAFYASSTVHAPLKENPISMNSNNISERAVKSFQKEFGASEHASWSQIKDGYLTRFQENGIKYRVGYNTKGYWQNTVKTYSESKLSSDIVKIISRDYPGFGIVLVEEITTREKTVYIVHIENDSWSKQVKVDGEDAYSLDDFDMKK